MEKLSQEQLITYIKKQKLRIKQLETENEDLTKSKSSEQIEQTLKSTDNTRQTNISNDSTLQINNLQQELDQLREAHESLKSDKSNYLNRITELQTLISTSRNEYNELQISSDNLYKSIQALTQQVNTHEAVSAELRDISGKYAQLSYQHEKLIEKYDTLHQSHLNCSDSSTALTAATANIASLTGQLDQVKAENNDRMTENQSHLTSIDTLKQEIAKLNQIISTHSTEKAEDEARILDRLIAILPDTTHPSLPHDTSNSITDTIAHIKHHIDSQAAIILSNEQHAQTQVGTIASLTAEVSRLTDTNEATSKIKEELALENNRLQTQIDELKSAIISLQQELSSTLPNTTTAPASTDDPLPSPSDQGTQTNGLDTHTADLSYELNTTKEELSRLQQEVLRYQEEIASLQHSYETAEAEKVEMIRASETAIERIRDELTDMHMQKEEAYKVQLELLHQELESKAVLSADHIASLQRQLNEHIQELDRLESDKSALITQHEADKSAIAHEYQLKLAELQSQLTALSTSTPITTATITATGSDDDAVDTHYIDRSAYIMLQEDKIALTKAVESHKAQVSSLEGEIQRLHHTHTTLSQQHDEHIASLTSQTSAQLTLAVDQAREEYDTKTEELIQTHRSSLAVLAKEHSQLIEDLQQRVDDSDVVLSAERVKLQGQIDTLTGERDELSTTLQSYKQQCETHEESIRQLELSHTTDIEGYIAQISKLEKAISQLTAQNNEDITSINTIYESKLITLQQEHQAALSTVQNEYKNTVSEYQSRITDLESQLATISKGAVEASEASHSSLLEEKETLTSTLHSLQARIESLLPENQQLQLTFTEMGQNYEGSIARLETELADVTTARTDEIAKLRADYDSRISALSTRHEAALATLTTEQTEVTRALEGQISDLYTHLTAKQVELDQAFTTLTALTTPPKPPSIDDIYTSEPYLSLQHQYNQLTLDLKTTQETLNKHEKSLTTINDKYTKLQIVAKKYKTSLSEKENEYNILHTQLENLQTTHNTIINDNMTTLNTLTTTITNLTEQLATSKRLIDESVTEKNILNQEIIDLKASFDSYKTRAQEALKRVSMDEVSQDKYIRLEEDNRDLLVTIEELRGYKEKYSVLQSEYDALLLAVSEKDKAAVEVSARVSELESLLGTLRKDNEDIHAEYETIKAQLSQQFDTSNGGSAIIPLGESGDDYDSPRTPTKPTLAQQNTTVTRTPAANLSSTPPPQTPYTPLLDDAMFTTPMTSQRGPAAPLSLPMEGAGMEMSGTKLTMKERLLLQQVSDYGTIRYMLYAVHTPSYRISCILNTRDYILTTYTIYCIYYILCFCSIDGCIGGVPAYHSPEGGGVHDGR